MTTASVATPQPPTTRERLLSEAARFFRRHGYAGTSTRVLSESLGITKATLYHHVRSKDALLLELCLESLARIDQAVVVALRGHDDSLDRLRAAVVAHVVSALEHADMHATMLIEMRALSPENHEEVRRGRAAYEARISALVEAAQRDGYLRSTLETKWMTLSLLNTLNWSIFWYRPGDELTPEQIGHILLDVYLNGVTTAPRRERAVKRSRSAAGQAAGESASQLDRLEGKLDALLGRCCDAADRS